jgi:hypothetical protein
MAAPDLALAAAQLGAVPAYMPAGTVAADLQSESTAWGEVIRDQKISGQ